MISWDQFLTVSLLLLTGYYLIIVFIFYRKRRTPSNSSDLPGRRANTLSPEDQSSPPPVKDSNSGPSAIFPLVHDLMEEVNALYDANRHQPVSKPSLLAALQIIIRKYPQLKDTAFMYAINNHIIAAAERGCQITLTADDVIGLWRQIKIQLHPPGEHEA